MAIVPKSTTTRRAAAVLVEVQLPGLRLRAARAWSRGCSRSTRPVGACPTCDGLGVSQFFDPARVVVHPDLSLAAGAVRGWDRRNAYYFQLIASLARHYGFDVDTPWQELAEDVRHAVLLRQRRGVITFTYLTDAGGRTQRKHRFEGIVPNLERRYRETESSAVREELAKYISERPAPTATARGSTGPRATCSSPIARCRPWSFCRSTRRWRSSAP
jgi:excinuclease UvrABC ATPase subunit